MSSSDAIATIALVISAASGWVSYLAYRHGVRAKDEERRMAFARQKSEFLVRIDKARKTFEALEFRLTQRVAAFEAPDGALGTVADNARRVAADLDYLKGCQRQA